ncbi:ribosomal RNA small subunit methyltransferase A, partial [Candidatus Falkowbacteria bacterium RIFCSPLOWO2_02_FULL_45_21]
MNLLEQTARLCRLYDIKPARSKGQNFLIREEIYNQMVAAADLKPADTVLEVGPGLGFMTAKLAARAGKVLAVELDDKLAEVLMTGLLAQGIKNVEVVNEDILKISICHPREGGNPEISKDNGRALFWIPDQVRDDRKKFKIVANLPYNITSIFLRKYLSEAEIKPELMVLMLQKEVAGRITAKPGEMSLLAVSVQFYAKAEIVEIVPKNNFWPKPEVDSAIIKLKVKSEKLKIKEKEFFRLVKFGFSAKRKMLKNNLAAGFRMEPAEAENKIKQVGFNGKIRAQELSVE